MGMEEEKKKKTVDGSRRGSQLQDRKLVGGNEAKAEEQDGGRKGRVRRATFDDFKAVMDINDNIYDGRDYMPKFFYIFMQSKLHTIYVYEEDGKLISLANIRLHPDCDDLVTVMSGRVRPSHEGRGLGFAPSSARFAQLLKEYPSVTRYVIDHLCTEQLSAKMHGRKVNYHWNMLAYKLADRQWLSRFSRISQMAFDANRPFSLSYTSGTEWLERSDQLIRFISKYVKDLFPVDATWIPTSTNRAGLRHVLSSTNVYISMNDMTSAIIDNTYSSSPISSSVGGPEGAGDKWQENDIVGLSYSTACPCKYGMRLDIFFYGDCEKVFLSHIYSHLQHYNRITSDDVRIGLMLHFPLTIDSRNVKELLKEALGEREQYFGATQAVQYIVDLPKAKL